MPINRLGGRRSQLARLGTHGIVKAAILVPLLALSSCAIPGTPLQEIAPVINASSAQIPTLLLPGDTIDIKFPNQEDYDQATEIRGDGNASFLKLGEIRCAGLTIDQLARALKDAYRANNYIADAEPTIKITKLAARSVYVMGEVKDPGLVDCPLAGITLLEALATAGGPIKETACLEQLVLVRSNPAKRQNSVWEIDASIDQWAGPATILLRPGDVIYIPNTPIDDVDIWVDQYIRRLIPVPMPAVPVY